MIFLRFVLTAGRGGLRFLIDSKEKIMADAVETSPGLTDVWVKGIPDTVVGLIQIIAARQGVRGGKSGACLWALTQFARGRQIGDFRPDIVPMPETYPGSAG